MENLELFKDVEAAKILNVATSTLRKWRCKGGGPAYRKLGRSCRYTIDDLRQYVEKQKIAR